MRQNFRRKVKVNTQIYIGTESKPDMRILGLLAVAPLYIRRFGANTEIDVDNRINMSGFENVLHKLRTIRELQSLRCEV